ncbi:MAG TPA: MFS transporter, partial [Deltaproteobacteria bacterium]|nr:MFS transporter [Deltaproteobacteria bacterium]
MATVFLITGIMTILLGTVSSSWVILIVFLQPVVAVCFFPPGFAALSSIGPPSTRSVIVSLTVPAAFLIGGGAIPAGIGMMGDAGSLGLGIVLTGALIGTGFLFALFLKISRS